MHNFFCHDALVGSFAANAWGVYDMHGNVWEWVEDCYNDSYVGALSDGSAWESEDCSSRVLRGGSWGNYRRYLRSAYRVRYTTDIRNHFYGFRIARTLVCQNGQHQGVVGSAMERPGMVMMRFGWCPFCPALVGKGHHYTLPCF